MKENREKSARTSIKVDEVVSLFRLLAEIITDTASLELVARGRTMKEMKKVGMLVVSEKLSTALIRGSANTAAIIAPSSRRSIAMMVVHLVF